MDYFDEFWALVLRTRTPRPVHKEAARKAFGARVKTLGVYGRLLEALSRYGKSKRVLAGFVQDAPTWIRDWESWENYDDGMDTKGMSRDEWAGMFPSRPYGHAKDCTCAKCGNYRGDQPEAGA